MNKLKTKYLVVGGGPSGLGISKALIERDKDFALIESRGELGGSLRYLFDPRLSKWGDPRVALGINLEDVKNLIADISKHPSILLNTYAIKISEKTLYALSRDMGLIEIDFKKAIVATGSRDASKWEMLIVGENVYNIFTSKAALELLSKGILPGKKILIYGNQPLTRFLVSIMKSLEKEGKIELVGVVVGSMVKRDVLYENVNLYIGKLASTSGRKRIRSVKVFNGSEEISIECDTLVLGERSKPNDFLLKNSDIDYQQEKNETSLESVYLCGEIIKDYEFIHEVVSDCEKFVESILDS